MSIIPCEQNKRLRSQIEEYAEVLKTNAHTLGDHGLSETEFYNGGLFRGVIERLRGQFSASMKQKRDFVKNVLNHMQDRGFIVEWEPAGATNRHDYKVVLNDNRIAVIELKGCLDGNNTNIFERPPNANEFIIWSICTNIGSDPRKNAWSGIHTRLSAEIIEREQRVDGIIIWDMYCGTYDRQCPKVINAPHRSTSLNSFLLPPPCIYVLPETIPSPRNNPRPCAQALDNVQILKAFADCFGSKPDEISYVDFEVDHRGAEVVRLTRVRREGRVQQESKPTPIRRS